MCNIFSFSTIWSSNKSRVSFSRFQDLYSLTYFNYPAFLEDQEWYRHYFIKWKPTWIVFCRIQGPRGHSVHLKETKSTWRSPPHTPAGRWSCFLASFQELFFPCFLCNFVQPMSLLLFPPSHQEPLTVPKMVKMPIFCRSWHEPARGWWRAAWTGHRAQWGCSTTWWKHIKNS